MEELLPRFFFDIEFAKWYEKRKMAFVAQHYQQVLHAVIEPKLRKILVDVVQKWLDDAYSNFGIETGQGKIIFCPVTEQELYKPKNNWRMKEKELRISFQKKQCIDFPKTGFYLFYHYFVEILQTSKQVEIYTGIMPKSLLKLLLHYLSHRFIRPEQSMGTQH